MAGNYNKQEKLWDIVGWMKHNTISEKIISNWRVYYRQHSITEGAGSGCNRSSSLHCGTDAHTTTVPGNKERERIACDHY